MSLTAWCCLTIITDLLHIKFEEPEEDTIGGLVFGLLERKPEPGDKIEVDGWSFEVLRAEGFRVTRVRAAKAAGNACLCG